MRFEIKRFRVIRDPQRVAAGFTPVACFEISYASGIRLREWTLARGTGGDPLLISPRRIAYGDKPQRAAFQFEPDTRIAIAAAAVKEYRERGGVAFDQPARAAA